jgi:hypothetical protein
LAVALATFATAMPAFATELTPHRAQYKVKILFVSGELNTELRATDDGFVALHVVKPKGMARVLTDGRMHHSSTFLTESSGVKPISYHAIDTITGDPEERIRFDWTTNQASGTVGDQEVLLQLDGVSHDNVSIQYQLMHDLLNGGPRETYVLFDVDKMRVADVRNVGTKTVKTKAGSYEVVGIQHQKEGSARITTLWCARELDYLPVIIEQHRLGKLKFRATLTSYTPT